MRLFWSKTTDGTMAVPPSKVLEELGIDEASAKEQMLENRRRFVSQYIDPVRVTAMRLGKSGNDEMIRILSGNHHTLDPERAVQAEALIMEKPSAIFAVVADCPAIALETKYSLALAHTGWRGTAGVPIDAIPDSRLDPGEGIISRVIDKLRQLDGNKRAIRAAISPAICGRHYTVHQDVAHLFQDGYVRYVKPVGQEDERGLLFSLDIPRIVRAQLARAKVRSRHIKAYSICTFEDPNLFSDRGWKQGGQEWGRMGVLVVAD